jgi:hypothetical protein
MSDCGSCGHPHDAHYQDSNGSILPYEGPDDDDFTQPNLHCHHCYEFQRFDRPEYKPVGWFMMCGGYRPLTRHKISPVNEPDWDI